MKISSENSTNHAREQKHINNNVKLIYDTWYQNNREPISHGKWRPLSKEVLDSPQLQTERGLNIITYLPSKMNHAIDTVLLPRLLPVIGEAVWVMPPEGRHITLLDILPHNTEPAVINAALQDKRYGSVVLNTIETFSEQIFVHLQGIFASPDGITIQGFPQGEALENLRLKLRSSIQAEGLINMETNKYLLQTAHVALIKFTSGLNGARLLDCVDTLRDTSIGTFIIKDCLLTISPRFDKSKTVKVLDKFSFRQVT